MSGNILIQLAHWHSSACSIPYLHNHAQRHTGTSTRRIPISSHLFTTAAAVVPLPAIFIQPAALNPPASLLFCCLRSPCQCHALFLVILDPLVLAICPVLRRMIEAQLACFRLSAACSFMRCHQRLPAVRQLSGIVRCPTSLAARQHAACARKGGLRCFGLI